MYRDIEILSLLPDRPGRGGTKFGYHAFQQEPLNDTREIKNVHVWQDSWRSDFAAGATFQAYNYPDTEFGAPDGKRPTLALHGYSKYSLEDPGAGPSLEIIGHNVGLNLGVKVGYLWNYTTYVDAEFELPFGSRPINVIEWASTNHPAVFVNIGNRCFIACGDREGIIYDSSSGVPTWSSTGKPRAYAIGVEAPTAAPSVSSITTESTAECYVHKFSAYLSHPDPAGALANAENGGGDALEVTSDGFTWTDAGGGTTGISLASKTTAFVTTGIYVSIANGSNIASFSPAASIPAGSAWVGLTLTVNGLSFVMMEFGNALPASTLTADQCRLATYYKGGKLPYDPETGGGGWDPADNITSQSFEITGVRFQMQRAGLAVGWPGGVSAATTTTGQLVDAGGLLTWSTLPPSYAYAWYDPTTGHISNISPIFAPTTTSETEVGVKINVDVGSISYPPSTSYVPSYPTLDTRWTHILFFRTLMAGGSTLYPIGSLQPTVADPDDPSSTTPNPAWKGLPNDVVTSIPPSGTGNFWYDSARDADLLISGALRAPQFTNGKPKFTQNGETTVLFPAHMAYWDGRLWIAATQDPAALHYSCDRVQCPFGVPEESFPDTNVLRIPASDGCVRGMKMVGESLLITTERWAYTIAGNNEANYRLVRISTRMAGVGDYQMDEFVSDVEGGGALVVFLGTDSKIYAMPLGGQAICISKEIQTYLDAAGLSYRVNYSVARIHCMSIAGRRMALAYIPAYGPTNGKTFIYDFDTKTWGEHTLQSATKSDNSGSEVSWANVTGTTSYQAEIYSIPSYDITPPISPPNIDLRGWLNPVVATPNPSGYVRTFPLNFDGKKTRKRLHFVRLYVNDMSYTTVDPGTGVPTYGWRVTVRKDSSATGTTVTPVAEYDQVYSRTPIGSSPIDGALVTELIATDAALTPDTPLIGYHFDVQVTFPGQTNKLYQLYKIEIGWSTMSEGQVDI